MFQKFAVLVVAAIVAIIASGCAGQGGGPFSSLHHGGEGVLAGAAAGGTTAAAITNGNLLWTFIGAGLGGLAGGIVGGQFSKGPGIVERDMNLQAKQFALQQECRRAEWQRVEQSVRYSQAYGGKAADYYQPDYSQCGGSVQQAQPRNINQPVQQPTYILQPNIRRQ